MTLVERLEVVAKRMEQNILGKKHPSEVREAAVRIAELESALDEITTSAYPIAGAMCVPVGAWENAMRLAKLKS